MSSVNNLLFSLPKSVLEYVIITDMLGNESDIKTLGLVSKEFLKLSQSILTGNNVFNKRRVVSFEIEIREKLSNKDTINWIGPERISLATQTLKIIVQSRLPLAKRVQCLNALSAALEDSCEPEAFTKFRQIATADIPHFILTRCWEIEMSWDSGHHYANPHYNPITKRALSALVQAQKNCLNKVYDKEDFCSVPQFVFTSKNYPVFGTKKKITYADLYFIQRFGKSYARKLIDNNLGVTNARELTVKERLGLTAEINQAVKVRLVHEKGFIFI